MMQTSAITISAQTIPWSIKQGLLEPVEKEERFQSAVTPLKLFFSRTPTRSSLTDEIERVIRQLESGGVRLKDRDAIWQYLLDFPGLMQVLPDAVQALKKHLETPQLILEVYRDPEIEDRYLMLCVRLKSYDASVLERLEAAEAEFIDRLAHEEGWLQVITDFEESEDAI